MAIVLTVLSLIALSSAALGVHLVRRRRQRREQAKRRAREVINRMRHAVRRDVKAEKDKAAFNAAEIMLLSRRGKFELHEVGISKQEIEKLIYLSKEEVAARDRERLAAIRKATAPAAAAARRPIVLPPPPMSEVVFTAAQLGGDAGCDGVTVDLVASDEDAAKAETSNDPVRALQGMDDGSLDAFIECGFARIRLKD